MSTANIQNKTNVVTTSVSKQALIPAAPSAELTFRAQTSASQYPSVTNHNITKAPDQDANTFLSEGKSAAITVNTPFTVIPGLPALNKILAKIDKTTQQDLGFTFKASAAKIPNQQGEQDLELSINYIGFGWMSSKFNVQFSPVSIKVESGLSNNEPHWGCSASVLSSPIGLVHERAGIKGTFSDCNSTRTFSAAPEISYQSSKTFKPLSTATGGYFFGNNGTFRIPAEYVPTLERIKAASPSMQEWETITDHITPSIPAIQIGKLIDHNIEIASNIILSATSVAESVIAPATQLKINLTNNLTHRSVDESLLLSGTASAQDKNKKSIPSNKLAHDSKHVENTITKINQEAHARKKQVIAQGIEPSIEEKANYTVQQNDTLAVIGRKTGHSWTEIYALNKKILKNNPDKIYPGQELLIPDPHDHSSLINHPVVQAQILANLAAHYAKQDEYSL